MCRRQAITRIETVLLIGMIAVVLAVVGGGVLRLQELHYRKVTEDRLKGLSQALWTCKH